MVCARQQKIEITHCRRDTLCALCCYLITISNALENEDENNNDIIKANVDVGASRRNNVHMVE